MIKYEIKDDVDICVTAFSLSLPLLQPTELPLLVVMYTFKLNNSRMSNNGIFNDEAKDGMDGIFPVCDSAFFTDEAKLLASDPKVRFFNSLGLATMILTILYDSFNSSHSAQHHNDQWA